MWIIPVQCDAVGVGGAHAEVHADQGQFFLRPYLTSIDWLNFSQVVLLIRSGVNAAEDVELDDPSVVYFPCRAQLTNTVFCRLPFLIYFLVICSTEHRLPVAVSVGSL